MGTINWSETEQHDVIDTLIPRRDNVATSITVGTDLEHTEDLMLQSAMRIIIDNEYWCEFSLWANREREFIEGEGPIQCRPMRLISVGVDEVYVVARKYDPSTGATSDEYSDCLFIPLVRIANVHIP